MVRRKVDANKRLDELEESANMNKEGKRIVFEEILRTHSHSHRSPCPLSRQEHPYTIRNIEEDSEAH